MHLHFIKYLIYSYNFKLFNCILCYVKVNILLRIQPIPLNSTCKIKKKNSFKELINSLKLFLIYLLSPLIISTPTLLYFSSILMFKLESVIIVSTLSNSHTLSKDTTSNLELSAKTIFF